jgi:choline-sulfatase
MLGRAHRPAPPGPHVDFLPTLAGLFAAPSSSRSAWQGRSYARIVLGQGAAPVQDHVVFTYDDYQAGQAKGPYVPPPQHIVSIRETRWKLARYYDPKGAVAPEWEMYDLRTDPLETTNLARRGYRRTRAQSAEYARLRRKLARVQATRLQPL